MPVVAAAGLAVEAAAAVLLPLMSVGGPLDLAPSPLDLPPSPTEDRPSLALTRSSSRPARRSLTALRIAVRGPTPSLVMRDHSGPMLEWRWLRGVRLLEIGLGLGLGLGSELGQGSESGSELGQGPGLGLGLLRLGVPLRCRGGALVRLLG